MSKRVLRCLALWSFFFSLALAQTAPAPASLVERARAALSPTKGEVRVPGLQHEVTVLRDHWGVPHIYAQNQHDLFLAQGYVAAQDRLFQMELWKRSGQGRLAEVAGPATLPRDIYARLLRYRGPMEAEYASYAPDAKEILTAFTDGINAFIRERTQPGGVLPVEFRLAGFAPEPWKPEDCLNRVAAFAMTGNAKRELANAQLLNALGPDQAAALLTLDPPVKLEAPPGTDYSGLSASLLAELVGSDTRVEFQAGAQQSAVEPEDLWLNGSNNWTISGKLTATGRPMLANDPHRTIAVPSLRYIVHLVAPGWDVIGATEPALPGIAAGHNARIAWGFTVFGLDQQDLYLETLNPQNPLEYRTAQGWEKIQVEKAVFKVRGAADREVELKFTRHGPVLWEDGRRALALHWVGAEPGAAGYLAQLSVDRARNWQEFLAAAERWKLPSENLVYADVDGNIGEQSAGLAPLRRNWTGLLPVPGNAGYEWAGFLKTSAQPRHFNPAAGFIATANHKMIPPDYPYAVGFEWAARDRVQRIEDVLNDARARGHRLDLADMQLLQTDVVSLPARQLVALLTAAAQAAHDNDSNVKLLTSWNGALTRESPGAALYELWLRALRAGLLQRAVPEKARNMVSMSMPLMLRLLSNPAAEVFGASPRQERDAFLLASARTAAAELAKLQGPDAAKWAWGKLHVVEFRHPLDRLPGAREITDLGPVERPGDGTTVNATGIGGNFRQIAGASYREIFDLSDWDRGVAVNVPGESGQPASPHYSDLLPLWSEGQYFPLRYSRAVVEKQTTDKLVLKP